MPAPNPIHTIGRILAPTSERTYRTALPNGKEVIAHFSKKNALIHGPLPAQTQVHLEMTSYDFNIARIARVVAAPPPPPL